jgi:hypothetical protein
VCRRVAVESAAGAGLLRPVVPASGTGGRTGGMRYEHLLCYGHSFDPKGKTSQAQIPVSAG